MNRLINFGAVAALVGGTLRIIAAFIPYTTESAGLETLYAVIDLGILFGLMALSIVTADRLGRTGLICATLSLAAIASIVGPDAKMFGIDFYWGGASLFSLGLAGLSVVLIRVKYFIWPARLWIISLGLGLLALTGSTAAFMAAGVLLGVGFALAGLSLMRREMPAVPRV